MVKYAYWIGHTVFYEAIIYNIQLVLYDTNKLFFIRKNTVHGAKVNFSCMWFTFDRVYYIYILLPGRWFKYFYMYKYIYMTNNVYREKFKLKVATFWALIGNVC